MQSVRKAYDFGEICNTGLVQFENNFADAFAKVQPNCPLRTIIL